jgi:hypothetical protein
MIQPDPARSSPIQPDPAQQALVLLIAGNPSKVLRDYIAPILTGVEYSNHSGYAKDIANHIDEAVALLQQHVEQAARLPDTSSPPAATSALTPDDQLTKDLQDLEDNLSSVLPVYSRTARQAIDEIHRLRDRARDIERIAGDLQFHARVALSELRGDTE